MPHAPTAVRPLRVLVVDDEDAIRFGIREYLSHHGHQVAEAADAHQAMTQVHVTRPHVVLLDYRLAEGDTLSLIGRIREVNGSTAIIMLTGFGTIPLAVDALKLGAEQFLTKPVELAALLPILERAVEAQRNVRKVRAHRVGDARAAADPFIGVGPRIRALAELAQRVARAGRPILLRGETGTGKGVLARWLHANGPRRDEAFVDLNCAGLSKTLLESELFGHEKGAFTGAATAKPGLIEIADGGTFFLDEIGDMDLEVQPRLLKVLEEGRFRHLGETRERTVDLHLVAATHRDLAAHITDGGFRADLYFRISTLTLDIPPLRERREDVPFLARHLARQISASLAREPVEFTERALSRMQSHAWPGNVRELRNVIERAILLMDKPALDAEDLLFDAIPWPEVRHTLGVPALAGGATMRDVERNHIEAALAAERGHVPSAARRLGIPRSTLYQRLKEFGIKPSAPS